MFKILKISRKNIRKKGMAFKPILKCLKNIRRAILTQTKKKLFSSLKNMPNGKWKDCAPLILIQ